MKAASLLNAFAMLLVPVFGAVSLGLASASAVPSPVVRSGISIQGIPLDGVQLGELPQRIHALREELSIPESILLEVDGKTIVLAREAIGLDVDSDATAARIVEHAQETLADQAWNLLAGRRATVVEPVLAADRDRIIAGLEQATSGWNSTPVDAALEMRDGLPTIVSDQPGRTFFVDAAADWVLTWPEPDEEGRVVCEDPDMLFLVQQADVTRESLSQHDQVAGSMERAFPVGLKRMMTAMAGRINGWRISPGSEISLLERAGGIDDTSDRMASALHAMLLSVPAMSVVERNPSEFVTDYAEAGMEAIVSGENQDLRFVSTAEKDLFILSRVEENRLFLWLVAAEPLKTRHIVGRTLSIIPPEMIVSRTQDLPPGEIRVLEAGREGVEVSIEDADTGEALHVNTYLPENRILEEGAPSAAPRK